MASDLISPNVVEWLGRAGYSVSQDPSGSGRVVVYSRGGEERWFIDLRGDGWIEVTTSSRGGPEVWECDLATACVLNHYLVALCGDSVRERSRLSGWLNLPIRLDALAPGADLRKLPGFESPGREELLLDGRLIGIFGFRAPNSHYAVEASNYCSLSVQELMDAYVSEDGAPFGTL